MATANAFMIFCHLNNLQKKNLTHYDFTMKLVEGLLEVEEQLSTPLTRGEKKASEVEENGDRHKFVQTELGTEGGTRRKRMVCKYHQTKKLTSYYCLQQNKTMIFVCPECSYLHE
jgi:hypothetical protein